MCVWLEVYRIVPSADEWFVIKTVYIKEDCIDEKGNIQDSKDRTEWEYLGIYTFPSGTGAYYIGRLPCNTILLGPKDQL